MRSRFAAIAALVCLSGCGLASFDVPASGTIEIPGSPLGAVEWVDQAIPLPASLTSMSLKDSKEFKNKDLSPSDVRSITLQSMKLEVVEGDSLDFLRTIEFWAATEGKPEIKIAEGTIPAGARGVTLDVTDAELKEYALAPAMTVTTKATGHPPLHDTEVRTTLRFYVEVF